VTSLFEQLVLINPDITQAQSAGFRSCLLSISENIETDPESLALSLQEWGSWLDEAGYERDNFSAMLLQIAEAELGVSASSTLWTYAQSIGTAAEGITSLIEHVQANYPGLEQRISSLEALALEDEGLIEETAGGTMSMKGKIITGGSVGLTLAAGYAIHRALQTRRARSLKETSDAYIADQVAKKEELEKSLIDHQTNSHAFITDRVRAKENLSFDDALELQKTFNERSGVFDFRKYAMSKAEGRAWEEFKTAAANRLWGDKYKIDRGELNHQLSDDERNLCKLLPANPERGGYGHRKLMDIQDKETREIWTRYVSELFTIEKSKDLLNMSGEEFFDFVKKPENIEFMRESGVAYVKNDAKIVVDQELIYFKDAFTSEVKSDTKILEQDIVKNIEKDIVIEVDNVLGDLERKIEKEAGKVVTKEDTEIIGIEDNLV
jgi:hypothetical protein